MQMRVALHLAYAFLPLVIYSSRRELILPVVDDAAVAIIYCRSSVSSSARVMTFIFILLRK
jgi:hypothetical protein